MLGGVNKRIQWVLIVGIPLLVTGALLTSAKGPPSVATTLFALYSAYLLVALSRTYLGYCGALISLAVLFTSFLAWVGLVYDLHGVLDPEVVPWYVASTLLPGFVSLFRRNELWGAGLASAIGAGIAVMPTLFVLLFVNGIGDKA